MLVATKNHSGKSFGLKARVTTEGFALKENPDRKKEVVD